MTHDSKPADRTSGLSRALVLWLSLAAAGQLVFLAHWPMYLMGTIVPRPAALGVALVRLAVYSGLAWGLAWRRPDAWAATVLELGRTFLMFVLLALRQEGTLYASAFPAGWTQGLLSAALPLLLVTNTALAIGWTPGAAFEAVLSVAARALSALSVLGALALRRRQAEFDVPVRGGARVILRGGLPVVLLISAAEALAFWAAGGAWGL